MLARNIFFLLLFLLIYSATKIEGRTVAKDYVEYICRDNKKAHAILSSYSEEKLEKVLDTFNIFIEEQNTLQAEGDRNNGDIRNKDIYKKLMLFLKIAYQKSFIFYIHCTE